MAQSKKFNVLLTAILERTEKKKGEKVNIKGINKKMSQN